MIRRGDSWQSAFVLFKAWMCSFCIGCVPGGPGGRYLVDDGVVDRQNLLR